jgi:catechol 2,3-dioxygenase-like lactoylglutathione lyase family enzyme
MPTSVRFYRDLLGLEIVYGSEDACFHVPDVDRFWAHLKDKGLRPEAPRDASWGERYFHLSDPDGHELSFAHPI